MAKIDYRRLILPDIEMYGGNTDHWEIDLFEEPGKRMSYEDAEYLTFTLVIKDFGYNHRENGMSYFTLTKEGYITDDGDGNATLNFKFVKDDTFSRYGKYTYQVIASGGSNGMRNVAQGNLFITKAIDQ